MQVTKQYRTETGHRLSDYDGKCSHLHGHSYLWEVTIHANDLTDNGMVVDFGVVKQAMVKVLEPLDHAMVLAPNDPLVLTYPVEELKDLLSATNNANPRLIIFHANPTAENFARWAAREIRIKLLNFYPFIKVMRVRVWETATSYAQWTGTVDVL